MAATVSTTSSGARRHVSAGATRLLMGVIIAGAIIAGFSLTGSEATNQAVSLAGADFARLLRAMAMIKAVLALGAITAVFWRLGTAISLPWFGAYAAACTAMAAGPGLIWAMAHVGLGAVLLHGGLLVACLLLWRDPVVSARLAAIVAARRLALR